MRPNIIPSKSFAFSLIEMLVVIAVIGVITAIAIPNIGNLNGSAKEATARRNAQNIAAVFVAGEAAGIDFVGSETDVAGVIARVVTGATVSEAPFEDAWFGVPNMPEAEQAEAAEYLIFDANTGQLLYNGAGN